MGPNETHVLYKAIADFSALSKAATKAKQDLRRLRQEEERLNKASAQDEQRLLTLRKQTDKASKDSAAGTRTATTNLKNYNKELKATKDSQVLFNRNLRTTLNLMGSYNTSLGNTKKNVMALRREQDKLNTSLGATKRKDKDDNDARRTRDQADAFNALNAALEKTTHALNRMADARSRIGHDRDDTRRRTQDMDRFGGSVHRATRTLSFFNDKLKDLKDWRPRLIPPFIALIPIIAALLALINPLVAGLSAVGMAAFGFASSLASLSGVVLSLAPGLVTLISLVGALKVAFGGIGAVFTKYQAMRDAATGGSGAGNAKEELTRAEQIARAQQRYAWALQDVKFAQEDLQKAKEDYLKTILKLQEALDDLIKTEEKALVNAQLSAEWAEHMAADPNVDEEDKVAAEAFAAEKAEEAAEATKKRQEAEEELNEAKKGGVENDRAVIMAQRRLTQALWAVRDAQLDVKNAAKGSGSATASAAAAFKKALDDLSPSARKFVEHIISMEKEWKKVKKAVQEAFFSNIIDQLDDLNRLLPPIKDLLIATSDAAGKVASNLLTQVSSPGWIKDLGSLSDTNAVLIEKYGEALGFLLETFKDLAIAASPLAEKIADAFSRSTESLSNLVKGARLDGSLADWLDTVYERLRLWWQIVKNIAKTLFNYGAATSEFGDWLTEGFKKATEGWLESSEAARKTGSKFKKYLEALSAPSGPLVAVNALLKDFFGWWVKVSQDPDNLEKFTQIFEDIRTKLGPALSRVLDMLAKSDVADSLLTALATLLEMIGDFLQAGGLEGMKAFYEALEAIFKVIGAIIKALPPDFVKVLAVSLMTIAALTFTGLSRVLGLLLKLAKSGAVSKFLAKLGAVAGVTAAAGGAGAVGAGAAAAGAGAAFVGGRTASGTIVTTGPGRGVKAGAAPKAKPKMGVKGGGLLGLGAMIVGSLVSDGQGGGRDIGGGVLTGAGLGASIGGLAGPLGALTGAIVGAIIGGVSAQMSQHTARRKAEEDAAEKEANKQGKTYYVDSSNRHGIPTMADKSHVEATKEADRIFGPKPVYDPSGLGGVAGATSDEEVFENQRRGYNLVYNSIIKANAEAKKYTKSQDELANSLYRANAMVLTAEEYQRAYASALEYVNGVYDRQTLLIEADTAVKEANATATDILKRIKDGEKVSSEEAMRAAQDLSAAYKDQADAILLAGGTQEEANEILKTGEKRLDKLAKAAGLSADEVDGLKASVLQLPTARKITLDVVMPKHARKLMEDFGATFGLGKDWTVEQQININIAKGGNTQNQPKKKGKGSNTGGMIYREDGGSVPGTGSTDTVPAMLTPGEFVLRKSITRALGMDNLYSLNSGNLTLSELLSRRQAPQLSYYNTGGLVGSPANMGSASSGVHYTIQTTINNPVGKSSEASMADLQQELAFKYGW